MKETVVQVAKANGVRWYGHAFRRKALEFEVKGDRKRERPKTWKTQVEKESKRVGLEKKGAMNRRRGRVEVRKIAGKVGYKPGSKLVDDDGGRTKEVKENFLFSST